MQEELQTFLEAPTARTYRRVREALLEQLASCDTTPSLSPRCLTELTELAVAEQFTTLLDVADSLQPAWALSPRIHYLAAIAAEECGDEEVAELERFTFQSCLEGILATGDGTAEAPYLITYLSDEYDVLSALGLEPRSQALVEQRGMLCDVTKCLDGSEVWFELTGIVHDPRERGAEFTLLQGLHL